MKIKVKPGQTVHTDGGLHTEGQEIEVTAAVGRSHIAFGRAVEVTDDPAPKKDTKPAK